LMIIGGILPFVLFQYKCSIRVPFVGTCLTKQF
jgi:hypothetical protein